MTYMSKQLTTKQQALLNHIRTQGEVRGIYMLAKVLDRPYKRVQENLRLLQSAGLVELSQSSENGRRVTIIQLPGTRKQPTLSFNRVWSSPITGVSDTVLIASVLAQPTFDDVLTCCRHYGVDRVRSVFTSMLGTGELEPLVQKTVGRMLANIEIGFARAA